MEVESVPISSVIPYDRNPRNNSGAVRKVAASIREFGFRQPIVVDEGMVVIAGHTRLLAAKELGLEAVPVHIARGLSPKQARAYRLADNRVAQEATWDDDKLREELAALRAEDFDLGLTGFDDAELAKALATVGENDPDVAPEAGVRAVAVLGDVWLLGPHRLVCGDCTDPASWDKLQIPDGFVVFSSPPYNVGDASGLRDKYQKGVPKSAKFYSKYDDDKTSDDYSELLQSVLIEALARCDAVALNVQPLAGCKRPLLRWMDANSDHLVDVITWDKGHGAPHIQKGILASRFEWIVVFSSAKNASRVIPHSSWQGKYSNVYSAPPQRDNEFASVHGATFPVHLPQFIVGDLMNRSRGVVDCFMGTGTTIIAAEMLGKTALGVELDPVYVDVAVKRWEQFTGKRATLEATGKSFEDMADARYDFRADGMGSYEEWCAHMRNKSAAA